MRFANVLLLAAALLLGGAVSASAQVIKFGTLAPEGSPWHEIAQDMAQAWKEASGGTVDVRIYPGGIAGDDPDMVRKMRIGQLQMAGLTGGGLTRIVPEINALQMPMLLTDDGELDYVRERISPELEAKLEAGGFKLLAWADVGWVHFFTNQPVVRPDDLRPLKIWIWAGDTTYLETWQDAGYQPVPLAATEIYTGLQSGLIDTVTTTPAAALSFQYYTMAGHMTGLSYAPFIGALVISTRAWNQIPENIRPRLLETAQETGRRVKGLVTTLNADAVTAMEQRGLVVHDIPPDAVAEWEDASRKAYTALVGNSVPAEMFARVEQLRDEYRAQQEQEQDQAQEQE